ncbi:hypothetical protein OH77DRAFT_170316 [Trametes cingulata]|nr:hypothetical protein OH77DRAFT_170316 [Trametes cingulata]
MSCATTLLSPRLLTPSSRAAVPAMQSPAQPDADRNVEKPADTAAQRPSRPVRWYYGFPWNPLDVAKKYRQVGWKLEYDIPDIDLDYLELAIREQLPGKDKLFDDVYRWLFVTAHHLTAMKWDRGNIVRGYRPGAPSKIVYKFLEARAYTEDELDATDPKFAARLPSFDGDREKAEQLLGPFSWYMDYNDACDYGPL